MKNINFLNIQNLVASLQCISLIKISNRKNDKLTKYLIISCDSLCTNFIFLN